MIRFLDWFAGLGGFRHGLEKANEKRWLLRQQDMQGCGPDPYECGEHGRQAPSGHLPQKSDSGFVCVGTCEIDKWCRRIYAKNFGHEPEWTDSRAVDPVSLPDFDLFCAGFPCQSFSIAGKRRGFRDIRGTLFFEIIRICGERQPRYLLLENVKGLLSVDNGFTFETILATLSDIGYDCQWEMLNSKNFGVPQNRERVFIVGHLRGQARPQIFPLGEDGKEDTVNESRITSYAIDSNYGKGCFTPGKSNTRTMIVHENISGMQTPHEEAQALRSGASHNYQTVVPVQIGQGRKSWAMKYGTSIGSQDKAYVLRQDNPNAVMLGNRIRRLTPLECERLQGFPDGWTEGVSDTQRYKMLGNAVTVNVIEAIGEGLLRSIAR